MNSNPTPGLVSRVQLLTKASFADLRGAKLFRCVRLVPAVGLEPTTIWSVAALDPLATLLQDGSTVKQMERSGLWLLTVRWSRKALLKSPDQQPTVDMAIAKDTPFIASGRRHESDNHLFLKRADAESFKGRIEENMKRKVSPKWKVKADIVEVTPEDVAHLDLDPAPRKIRNVKV